MKGEMHNDYERRTRVIDVVNRRRRAGGDLFVK
jgi:hypothetical protein